jgi:uncharacterized membrane protein
MRIYATAFAATAFVFLVLDSIWLGVVAIGFYRDTIGHLLAAEPDFVAAACFYALYLLGVLYFAVAPAVTRGNLTSATLSGAFLGLVAYGTYDLTNMATMRDWPLSVTVVDLLWGAFVTGAASAAGYLAGRRLSV